MHFSYSFMIEGMVVKTTSFPQTFAKALWRGIGCETMKTWVQANSGARATGDVVAWAPLAGRQAPRA